MQRIELGMKVQDTITNVIGTVTGRFEYLAGYARIEVTGERKGKVVTHVFDESLLLPVQ